ncbi:MAG: bifunctional heptose 7-phosphate kinase/heptose 1-phosphate adenyltransferase [Candidatus Acidiferrales bacterium]
MTPANRKGTRRTRRAATNAADSSVDLTRLLDIVAAFPRQTVCVAGDFVLDEFVSAEISRVSREAPVLILRHRQTEVYPGGAGNAAANLAELGARVLAVGGVGDDEGGRMLVECLRRRHVDVSRIARLRDWVTPRKTRYLAGWTHTTEQQVLRVDREPGEALPRAAQEGLARKARGAAKRSAAVLVSDYGFGAATPEMVKGLRAKCVTLDSRYRLLAYADTGVIAATPNEAELETAYHQRIGTDARKLEELGDRALRELGAECLVVTRGNDGMAVFEQDAKARDSDPKPPVHIPIYGSDSPVDVTGAGDTVIAVFTLALAARATYLEAAHLANYAGGIVVMKRRTATLTRAALESALRREATAQR